MAEALREAAGWVGCDAVRIERVDRPELARSRSAARGLRSDRGHGPGPAAPDRRPAHLISRIFSRIA